MSQLKNLLVILLILVLGVAAFLMLKTGYFDDQWEGTEMIPPNAVFVFETDDPVGFWNSLVQQPVWEKLHQFAGLQQLESQLVFLDNITGNQGNLHQFLKGQRFRLSLHPLGKQSFGFLAATAFTNREFLPFIKNLEQKFKNQGGEVKRRSYSGISLFEISLENGEKRFTYAIVDNVLLGSYHSFLVEDAIRYAQSEGLKNFKETFPHLFSKDSELPPQGLVHFSGKNFANFIQELTLGSSNKLVEDLRAGDFSANLIPGFSDAAIEFRGDVFVAGTLQELGSEAAISEVSQEMNSLISNRSMLVSSYWMSDLTDFERITNPSFSAKPVVQAELENSLEIQNFRRTITGQTVLVIEEGLLEESPRQLLILGTNDPFGSLEHLNSFSLAVNQNDSTTVFRDYYRGTEVVLLDLEEFPAHLFSGNFTGFSKTYFAAVNGQLVFANSLRTLRNLLDDVYQDNTWGKSIWQQEHLKQHARAPIRFFLNNDRFFPALTGNSDPSWAALFQKYAEVFGSFDWLSVSFLESGKLAIDLAINLEEKAASRSLILTESRSSAFDKPLIYGPAGLQNYNDRSTDFLVQDEDYFVHLLTNEGELVFTQRIPGEIISDVFQIDFYENGKLQLVFATQNLVYALDRYGNLLPGFPIHFEAGVNIAHLNVLDYDNSRDYRFFVADQQGNLYLYSRTGELLDDWAPKQTNRGVLASPPAHHRVPGLGDFMVALHANGSLGLYSRRGESKTGGPIVLGEGISTAYGIEEGIVEGQARLVTINDAGEVVKVNFKGELTYRNQLLRPDRDTRFSLVNDQNDSDFVWVIKEYNQLKVLSPDERLLFGLDILSEELDYRYFSFGPENKIFAVLDRVQDFAYLYNRDGTLINQKPVNVSGDLWVEFSGSTNEYSLVTVYMNRLNEYKIPL
ncbi:hypothetical protein [Cyclobacterium xiamenense]|uniref:hypothetical protein n=1 Tax=Cyclobacterium xiamenense TaxID=1297121 RepID=UPI0012B9AA12|nr:hypothetical protein [Cyclobacterium xiamenense]